MIRFEVYAPRTINQEASDHENKTDGGCACKTNVYWKRDCTALCGWDSANASAGQTKSFALTAVFLAPTFADESTRYV